MLKLSARTRDEVRASLAAMDPAIQAQISPAWRALFEQSAFEDPWIHGFNLLLPDATNVGLGSFKGPPLSGVVEIAYAILPQHQGRGYATAAARAMVDFALRSPEVSKVVAHTLPGGAASKRVLSKSGVRRAGEVVDPQDGRVLRFEISRDEARVK